MRVSIVPNVEVEGVYNTWLNKGIQGVVSEEVMCESIVNEIQGLLEIINKVATHVVAIACIGELLIAYREGKLTKRKTMEIVGKYGLIAFIVFLIPLLFNRYVG